MISIRFDKKYMNNVCIKICHINHFYDFKRWIFSWNFVCIKDKQCISQFNLTNLLHILKLAILHFDPNIHKNVLDKISVKLLWKLFREFLVEINLWNFVYVQAKQCKTKLFWRIFSNSQFSRPENLRKSCIKFPSNYLGSCFANF